MLNDDRVVALWTKLSNEFNIHVRSIGVGLKDGNECAVVTVDDKTDPAVIAKLPQKFENEVVVYKTGGPVVPLAGCGQPGHQCVCGTAPKP